MKLYHASKSKFDTLKRQQATMTEGVEVPEAELQNKIYFTPSLGFALAMAAGPDGMTSLVEKTISFENAKDFDPEQVIYVYEVDSDNVAGSLVEKVDDEQVAVDLDELHPDNIKEYKAQDVFDYYKLVDWIHPNER